MYPNPYRCETSTSPRRHRYHGVGAVNRAGNMVSRARGPRSLADGTPLAVHIVIPDSQVRPGVPTAHLGWIGQYILDEFAGHPNVKIIHLGDFADMASLSSYDKGKKRMEGKGTSPTSPRPTAPSRS